MPLPLEGNPVSVAMAVMAELFLSKTLHKTQASVHSVGAQRGVLCWNFKKKKAYISFSFVHNIVNPASVDC
jgi:hypothetical protein